MHDTALSQLACVPLGVGMVCGNQLVPFQRSTKPSGSPLGVLAAVPTAMHAWVNGHATPDRTVGVAPVGSGVDEIDQPVPFQTSANVAASPTPFPAAGTGKTDPTAVQAVAEAHDTPMK